MTEVEVTGWDPVRVSSLVGAGSRFARAALEDYRHARPDFFALHAATAFEQLGKAVLAKTNPILLLELGRKDPESFFHLAGVRKATRLRTIGTQEVLTRLTIVHPDIDLRTKDIETLIDKRNATAHLTTTYGDDHTNLVRWLRACNLLLVKLKDSGTDYSRTFFGADQEMVNSALADYHDNIRCKVETKVAGAKQQFAHWRTGLDDAAVQTLRGKRAVSPFGDDQPAACPVCGFIGTVTGSSISWEEETDHGTVEGPWQLQADLFRCTVCGLRLDSWDELEAAGMETIYQIESSVAEEHLASDVDGLDKGGGR